MTSPYWVQFDGRAPGTVEAADESAAREDAAKLGKVVAVNVLPYPRSPVLVRKGATPAFCFGGAECLGRTACPRRRACDD